MTSLPEQIDEPKANRGWKERIAHQTPCIQDKIVRIGESLWYSTSYRRGEKGMVEYNYKTNKIINIIKYPKNMTPGAHCCCSYNNNIYIIDGKYNHEIILFNTSNHSFTKKINIPDIGGGSSCVAIDDTIHICSGNNTAKHIIYSITNNTVRIYDDSTANENHAPNLLKYQNNIIKFGGWSSAYQQGLDTFYSTSTTQKQETISWTLQEKYRLKRRASSSGYIIFDHYIIIFGGHEDNGPYMDSIYALDLECDVGWIEMKHIKCPLASNYRAVLDGDDNVHLFTQVNQHPWQKSEIKHFMICIGEILIDVRILVSGYMRVFVFGKNLIEEEQYDILMNAIIVDYLGIVSN